MRDVAGWLIVAMTVCAPALEAQNARGALRLEIRPRAGDTLHVRLEQRVEITGVVRIGNSDSTITSRNELSMLGRTVVQRSDETGATVLSIVDSVEMRLAQQTPEMVETMRRGLQGHQLRMRLSPDGTASLLNAPDEVPGEMHAMVAQMPATLPDHPVRVGERWTREMAFPEQATEAGVASVRVTFRLDSLTRNGRYAHISMRGELSREQGTRALPNGITVTTTGSLIGYLVVDRERGWMMESGSTVTVSSTLVPPMADAQTMIVRMHVTQRMRTLDNR